MGCFSCWKEQRQAEPERIEKPRRVEVVPERRQTIRATTEFKWPARIGDIATSSLTQLQQVPQMPEKEVFVSTPTSFRSLGASSPLPVHASHQHPRHDHDYHISPQPHECQQCWNEKQQQLQVQQQKRQKYPTGSTQEPAELPPNDLSELHPPPQELPAATPPLSFPQELEGTLAPPTPRTVPRSRFSYQI